MIINKITFVGKMHSGKTTALNKIQELANKSNKLPMLIKFAKPLYDTQKIFLGNKDVKKNRLFLQDLSTLSKKHFGNDILSKLFKERVEYLEKNIHHLIYQETPNDKIELTLLCDDVRTHSNFDTARECGFIIVGIKASDEIRKNRNPELFVGTDHITEIQVDELIEESDIKIDGNLEINEFRKEVEKIWNDYLIYNY